MNRFLLHASLCGIALMLPAGLCAQETDSLGQQAQKENTLKVDLQMLTHGEITAKSATEEWQRRMKTTSRNS